MINIAMSRQAVGQKISVGQLAKLVKKVLAYPHSKND